MGLQLCCFLIWWGVFIRIQIYIPLFRLVINILSSMHYLTFALRRNNWLHLCKGLNQLISWYIKNDLQLELAKFSDKKQCYDFIARLLIALSILNIRLYKLFNWIKYQCIFSSFSLLVEPRVLAPRRRRTGQLHPLFQFSNNVSSI